MSHADRIAEQLRIAEEWSDEETEEETEGDR